MFNWQQEIVRLSALFDSVKNLNLPSSDFAIFGSGPLVVRGIIPQANDVDVICRGSAWDIVRSVGRLEYLEAYDVTIVSVCDGQISFGTKWGIGEFDEDELIDNAIHIDGLPFVSLKDVVRYKLIRGSPKDLAHLEALKKHGYADLLAVPG